MSLRQQAKNLFYEIFRFAQYDKWVNFRLNSRNLLNFECFLLTYPQTIRRDDFVKILIYLVTVL